MSGTVDEEGWARMGRFDGVGTLYRVFRGEQVGEPFATPHVVVADGRHRLLKRYDPTGTRIDAPPVLLIPPLAVSSSCYDLAPGLSFIEFLTSTGRTVYLVDFGDMDRTDRDLGFAGFFADIVPEAIRRVIGDSGAEMVDLVAWSIGGTLGFLTLAADPGLPVRSMTAVGTPLDYAPVAMYRLGRALTRPTNGKAITVVLRALGGIPAPVVRTVYRATAWQRELKKPGYIMSNADNPDALARMQASIGFRPRCPDIRARCPRRCGRTSSIVPNLPAVHCISATGCWNSRRSPSPSPSSAVTATRSSVGRPRITASSCSTVRSTSSSRRSSRVTSA